MGLQPQVRFRTSIDVVELGFHIMATKRSGTSPDAPLLFIIRVAARYIDCPSSWRVTS